MPTTSKELDGSGHVKAICAVSAEGAIATALGSASPESVNVSVIVFAGAAVGPAIGGGGGGGGGSGGGGGGGGGSSRMNSVVTDADSPVDSVTDVTPVPTLPDGRTRPTIVA